MSRDGDQATNVAEPWLDPRVALFQVPGNAADQHAVEPALQHRRLSAPPRGIDEDQRVAPHQQFAIPVEPRIDRGRVEVVESLLQRQRRLELVVVQICHPNVVAGLLQRLDGAAAHCRGERLGVWMAIDDVDLHNDCIFRSTRFRKAARCSTVRVSMEYSASHDRRVTRAVLSRSARSNVRRPLSWMAFT